MEIRTEDYELLGKFYLGREYDVEAREMTEDLVLYDSKDLVTHGVVLGMTGSGKTGLCIALLEEAAMDNIPAIVIDPKGDIGNLLLAFPDLTPESFRPWINEEDARKRDLNPEEHAAKTAETWSKGLASWGQTPERIREFRERIDIAIYTPGSSAGLSVSILSSFDLPCSEVLDDSEALGERVESTVSSILSLIGAKADPIQDPEHILLSNVFLHAWRGGHGVTLESLIRHIQQPPFDKIGVMDLEAVCPEKSRRDLALRLNNLLASPGFATWLEGEPLDIQRMLHTPEGKPRISIFSIAHLGDAERMFFVSLLLNETLGWMRGQSGTSSLRAILYMDEIFGYLPPTAMPPSKKPLLTMLKQARAYGLGLLLATQNPVDLDYRALSNIGTWWLGRLQTERDKARLLDGLQGAAAGSDSGFDRATMDTLISGLGNRVFLMNNVHQGGPLVFHVRWVMSYLRGPLDRGQIRRLMDGRRPVPAAATGSVAAGTPAAEASSTAVQAPGAPPQQTMRPRLPRGAVDLYVPAGPGVPAAEVSYVPTVLRVGKVWFEDARRGVSGTEEVVFVNPVDPGSGDVDWNRSLDLPESLCLTQLGSEPLEGAAFAPLPQALLESKFWSDLDKGLVDQLYNRHRATIYHSPMTKLFSKLGESEGDFRARLVHAAHEARDAAVEKLSETYAKRMRTLEDRARRALDDLELRKSRAASAKMDTAMRVGTTILSAVMGRSVVTQSRTAMSGASRAMQERQKVSQAGENVERLRQELEEMERQCREEVEKLKESMDPLSEALETVSLTPLKKNCSAERIGVVWMPYRVNPQPQLGAAW